MSDDLRLEKGPGKKVRIQVNASMNDEDMEILDELKKLMGVNTTAIIKLLLREGLEKRKAVHNDHIPRTTRK